MFQPGRDHVFWQTSFLLVSQRLSLSRCKNGFQELTGLHVGNPILVTFSTDQVVIVSGLKFNYKTQKKPGKTKQGHGWTKPGKIKIKHID